MTVAIASIPPLGTTERTSLGFSCRAVYNYEKDIENTKPKLNNGTGPWMKKK
jgi:hypothetical protein